MRDLYGQPLAVRGDTDELRLNFGVSMDAPGPFTHARSFKPFFTGMSFRLPTRSLQSGMYSTGSFHLNEPRCNMKFDHIRARVSMRTAALPAG